MAWRNVWRNRRRSIVTIAATSLALFVLIQYAGMLEGYLAGMESNILNLELGDAQVFARGFRDDPSLHQKMDDADHIVAALEQAGYRAAPRLLGGGLIAANDTSAGVSLRGIDIARDATVSHVGQHIDRGQWLDESDPLGVVVGRRLARTLNVDVGSEVVVLSQAADGSMANEVYTVRGVLKAISDGVDRTGMFLPAASFRELMVLPTGAHQLVVRKPDGVPLADAAAKIRALAGEHETRTWRELAPTLASGLDAARGMMFTMFFIMYVAVGILILNAMLMAVFERIREFGVLKALGAGPSVVLRLIFAETFIQAALAIVIGTVATIPGLAYLSERGIDTGSLGGMSVHGIAWDPTWRASIHPRIFSGPIATLLVVVFLAVLYPAIKAALIRPVQAIQHN